MPTWRTAKLTRCTYCNGRGTVLHAYGEHRGTRQPCKACNGTGRRDGAIPESIDTPPKPPRSTRDDDLPW